MTLFLWRLALGAEVLLLALLLWGRRLPWFTVWVTCRLATSAIQMCFMHNGTVYDPLWRATEIALLVPLTAATAEASIHESWRKPAIYSAVTTTVLLFTLRVAAQWPELQRVYMIISAVNLFLGLFMVQVYAYGRGGRRTVGYTAAYGRGEMRVLILILYMLGIASCYCAAPAFQSVIGRAMMGVELAAVVGWIVVEWSARRESNPHRSGYR